MAKFEIKKFDMKSIKFRPDENKGPVIILLGRRDTGKSVLVKDILYHQQDIPMGTVISGTEAGNGFYAKHIPKMLIHNEYDSAIIQRVLLRQKKILKDVETQMQTYRKCNIDPRTFVILDDCLYDSTWARDKLMRCLFLNGRHWKVFLIITMQYPLGIPPMLRSNIDFVFILRDNILGNRRKIYENYCGMFPTFESFCAILDQTTENYECLVINNNVKSNQLQDQIFWYKAEVNRPDFKMCSKDIWEASKKFDDDDDEDTFDPNSAKKKKGGDIIVKKTKW